MDPQLTTQAGEAIRRRPSISPDKKYERCMNIVPCEDGSSCTFAHSKEELHHWFQSRVKEEPRLHPTRGARPPYQMCKIVESNGYCPHDVHCNFPHSKEEIEAWESTIQEREEVSIRPRPEIHPLAHYDICKNAAPCPKGLKCTFAHSEEELHVWFQTRVKEEPRKQRPKGAWPPFQKCKNVEDTGYCQFDVHCNFWHSEEELKAWERNMQEGKNVLIRSRPGIEPSARYDICKNSAPCPNGSNCTFAHSEEELHHWFQSRVKEEPRLHPTKGARPPYKMCKAAESNGYCPHDVHCNFAHSKEEIEAWKSTIQEREEESIRPRPEIHPLAHYDICKNAAPCPNGLTCTFAHSEKELHVWFQTRVREEPRKQPPKEAWPPFQKCKNVEDTGYCQFDVHCNFWHSEEELKAWERNMPEGEKVPIRPRPEIESSACYDICKNSAPCPNGTDCTFAHSEEELHHWFQSRVKEEPRLHPTKGARPPYQMCKAAESNGYCPHDVHCNFPHSKEEIEAWKSTIQEREEVSIRPRPEIPPLAHYDICKNAAPCPKGLKCTFAHSEEELHDWFQTRVKEEPRKQPPKEAWPPFQKCKNVEDTGYCSFDVHCNFWHSEEELKAWERYVQEGEEVPIRPRPEIDPFASYKMCRNEVPCLYGQNCTFAHSEEELCHWIQSRVKDKPRQDPPALVKPDYRICKNVEERGYCPSDVHCHCPHSKEELDAWLACRPPASVHDDVQTGPQQKYQQPELQSAVHLPEAAATVDTETNEHEYKHHHVQRSKNKASQPGTDLKMKDAALLLQCPTEQLFIKFVVPHVIHVWRRLGINLGVPAIEVEAIHREEKDSTYACIKMFTQWLCDGAHQQGGGCTWKELLEAVSDSSGLGVSSEIEQMVTKHLALVQAQQQAQASVHDDVPEAAVRMMWPLVAELRQGGLITSEESERLSENFDDVVRIQICKSLEVVIKTSDVLRRHGLEKESKVLSVFAILQQADLITSEDSNGLSDLSDLVRVQGSKSLEILDKTADALKMAGLETESKLLIVMVELQQNDLITTEDRKNLSNICAVVSVQRRKSPDVMCKTANILERHGFVEETKSLQDAAEHKFKESLDEVLHSQANVTLQITKCTTIGPPRTGKTCLKHLLTGQKWERETASTDVMEAPEWVECYRIGEEGAEELWKLLSTEDQTGELLLAITSTQLENAHSDATSSPDITFPTDTLSDDSFTSTPTDVPPTSAISDATNAPKDNVPAITPDGPTMTNTLMTGLTSRQQKLQDLLKHSKGRVLGEKSLVYFTDTGGQAIYHDVHPVLLTTPSVYLLVFSLKELHDQKSNFKSKLIQHPLRSIYTFGTRKFQGSQLLGYPEVPTVFIVGTHLDLIQEENDCDDFLSKLHEMISFEIGNKPYRQFVQYDPNGRSFWAVDNTKAGSEQDEDFKKYISALRNAVLDPSMEMSVKVPLAWMLLKDDMDSKGMGCCRYSQLQEKACSSNIVKESSASEDLDIMLRLFHMLGLVYHKVPRGYKKEESLVFIDPDCLYSATSDFLMAAKEEIEDSSKDQQQRQAATMEKTEDINGGSEEVAHQIQTATKDEHEFIQEDNGEGQQLKQPAKMELYLDEEVVGIVNKKVMERIQSKNADYQRNINTVLKTVEDIMEGFGQQPTEVVLKSLHAQLNKYCEKLKQQCELSHKEFPHVSSMAAKQQLLTCKRVHSLVSTVQGLMGDSAEKGEAHVKEVMVNAIESVKAQCQSRLITDTEQFLAILADLRIVAKVDSDRFVVPAALPEVSRQIHKKVASILVTVVSQTIMQVCYLPSGLFCCLISELVSGLRWTVIPVGRTHVAFEQIGLPGRVHINERESYIEVTLESEAPPNLPQTCQTIRKHIHDSIVKVCSDHYSTFGATFDEALVWGFQCEEHQGTNEAETHIAAVNEDGGSFYAECLLQGCNAVQDVTSEQHVWISNIERKRSLETVSSSSRLKAVKASLPVSTLSIPDPSDPGATTTKQTRRFKDSSVSTLSIPDPSDPGTTTTKQTRRFKDSSEPKTALQADARTEVDTDFKLTKCIIIGSQYRMQQRSENQPWMKYAHVLSGKTQYLDMYECNGKLPDKGHVLLLINTPSLDLYPLQLLITPIYCIYIITFDLPEGEDHDKAEKELDAIQNTLKDVYAYSRDTDVDPDVFLVGLQKERKERRSFSEKLKKRLSEKPYVSMLIHCSEADIYWTHHGEEFTLHGRSDLLNSIQKKSCLHEGLSHELLAHHCELHHMYKVAVVDPFVCYDRVKEKVSSVVSNIIGSTTFEQSLLLLHQFGLICYRSLSELRSGLGESQNVVVLQPQYLRQLFEGVQELRVSKKWPFGTIKDLLNAHGKHVRDKKEWFQAMCISMGLVIERAIKPGKPQYIFVMGLDPECNPPDREHYSVDPLLFTCWSENIVSKDDFFLPSSLFPAFVASFLKTLKPERPPFQMKRHYLYVRTKLQNITTDVHVVERESFIEIGLQHLTAGMKHLTKDQVLDKLQLSCQGIKDIVIESAKQAADCAKLQTSDLKYGFLCPSCSECDCFGETKFDQDNGTIIALTCSRWYGEQTTTPQQQIWFNIVTNQMVVEKHVPNPNKSDIKIQIWKLEAISVCQASKQRPVSSSFPAVHEQTDPERKAVESGLTADSPHSKEETDQGSSILSQNVYERSDYQVLLRKYVSRVGAEHGKAVLECLGLEVAIINLCFQNNPKSVEEAVHSGLIKWTEGQSRLPTTWKVLLQAMENNISVQYIDNLKTELGSCPTSSMDKVYRGGGGGAPVHSRSSDQRDSSASGTKRTRRLSDSSAAAQSTPDSSDSDETSTKQTRRLSDSSGHAPAQRTPDPSVSSASGTMQTSGSGVSDSTAAAQSTPDLSDCDETSTKQTRRLSDSSGHAAAQSTPDSSDCDETSTKQTRRLSESSGHAPAQSPPDPSDSSASGTMQTSGLSHSTALAQITPDPGDSGASLVKQIHGPSDSSIQQVRVWEDRFIVAVDANAILSKLVETDIISDDYQTKVSQMTNQAEQNQFLWSHFMKTCETRDLMEVCDIISAVKGNRKMKRLGLDMKDMLEKGLSGGATPK